MVNTSEMLASKPTITIKGIGFFLRQRGAGCQSEKSEAHGRHDPRQDGRCETGDRRFVEEARRSYSSRAGGAE